MDFKQESSKYLMNTYGRLPVAFVSGEGVKLKDSEGREYIDFVAGLAVANLGHAHPKVAAAICEQARKLVHTSNLYHILPQIELGRWLVEHSFADRAFFCNSGAEANEAALKLARRWAGKHRSGAHEIITTEGSFHGRTMFALSVTGQTKFHSGFEPLVPGVVMVPYNDPDAVEAAVTERTAALIVEPIQGEIGVRVPGDDYLKKLRDICDRNEIILIFDEVQTGMGRTGYLFAHEAWGVVPDVITLAKALGNGFPIGAMLANEKTASAFEPGSHAATFGGNHLACCAALAVVEEFEDGSLLEHVRETGGYFKGRLQELADKYDCVAEVRGKGLHLAMELDRPGAQAMKYCMDKGMIINCTAERVLRFVPPLIIKKEEIDLLLPVLDEALRGVEDGK